MTRNENVKKVTDNLSQSQPIKGYDVKSTVESLGNNMKEGVGREGGWGGGVWGGGENVKSRN